MSVKIREADFVDHQKSRTLPQDIRTDRVIHQTDHELLTRLRHQNGGDPIAAHRCP